MLSPHIYYYFCCRAEKDAKREEKLLIKQLEKTKREVEKEKKRVDRESEKEKCQSASVIPSVLCFLSLTIAASVICGDFL